MGEARRRKLAMQQGTLKPLNSDQWGFDYGISANVGALGSIGFVDKLRAADIVAVAYGTTFSNEINCNVPVLSLIGRNEVPLREAFQEFIGWAQYSDADALDLTIVIMKAGGYKIIISPEPTSLINRTLKYDICTNPSCFNVSWIKPIDTLSKPLLQLRSYLEKGMRPYIFSASVYTGITIQAQPMPEHIRHIEGIGDLLKYQIRFVDEGSTKNIEWQNMATLSIDRNKDKKIFNTCHESLIETRQQRLKTIFPVTTWNIINNQIFADICLQSKKHSLTDLQIQQAICNLVISQEIGSGSLHFQGISKDNWPMILVDKIRQRFEIADNRFRRELPFNSENVVRQAVLDSCYLLDGLNIKYTSQDVKYIQDKLACSNLL